MKNCGSLILSYLALCIATLPAQFEVRREGNNVRLLWPAELDSWILESSQDLGKTKPWTIVGGSPKVSAGKRFLDLPIIGAQQYVRLRGSGGIIFVDDSNASTGNGSLAKPYQTISLAAAEARTRVPQTFAPGMRANRVEKVARESVSTPMERPT